MNMKVLYRILSGACMTLLFIACEDESSATPYARMTVDKTTLQLNESMVVKFTGIADQVAIFTGDESHNYELRSQNNTGMVVNKGVFTYSYSVPGTYRVVCVASTYLDLGKDMRVDTASVIVNVVDNVTDIDKLSSKNYYDEIYAEEKENDEWLLMLPYKMRYNNKDLSISMSQKLNFSIASDSTKVFINDRLYSSNTKYDLSSPMDILVEAYSGTERHYKLYTCYYPEFKSFRVAGVAGILDRSAFDYTTFDLYVTLPEGTDTGALVPVFETLSPSDKVYINDVEQISGSSAVDFDKAVSYKLVSSVDGANEMEVVSTVNVMVTLK